MERKAVLHQVFADAGWECPQILHAMDQINDLYYDRVSQIRMDGWSEGRVMLIGDAAACVSLLAGEGAGLAMTEAYVLAGELNRAGHDYQAAYRRYEQLMRPFVEGKQKLARYFASALVPKTWAGVWLRNQATKLMAFPALAHYFFVPNCGTISIFRIMSIEFPRNGNPRDNRYRTASALIRWLRTFKARQPSLSQRPTGSDSARQSVRLDLNRSGGWDLVFETPVIRPRTGSRLQGPTHPAAWQ